MNSSSHRSNDGGLTFPESVGGCGDCHDDGWIPLSGDHWITTGDGGAGISSQPWPQLHQCGAADRPDVPRGRGQPDALHVLSNRQDCCTMRGGSSDAVVVANVPSYRDTAASVGVRRQAGGRGAGQGFGGGGSEGGGGGRGRGGAAATLTSTAWPQRLGGCESGFTLPAPAIRTSSGPPATATRSRATTRKIGQARSVSPWIAHARPPPNRIKYRCHWTPPLAIDPFDHETVYYGCQVIFKTTNGARAGA